MGSVDIAVATWSGLRDLAPEDRLLIAQLRRLGVSAEGAVWDDPKVRWPEYRAVLIRSTWDYYRRRGLYLRWVSRVARRSAVWNTPEIVRDNTDKSYLRSLERRGIPIVPTIWARAGRPTDIGKILRRAGWAQFIVKPSISADGYLTRRFRLSEIGAAALHLEEVLGHSDAMIQPYMEALETTGERSLVYLDGRYSHSVRRARILESGGRGTPEPPLPPPRAARTLGDRAMASVPGRPLYGRVDMVPDERGRWRVLELELTEPSLYLEAAPGAVQTFAEAIVRRLRETANAGRSG